MAGQRRNDPFWNGWFWSGDWDPKTDLNGSAPFVFFKDLNTKGTSKPNSGVEIAIDAANSRLHGETMSVRSYFHINNPSYVKMLENMIKTEYEKEQSFLNWMRQNPDVPKKLKDLASQDNWEEFVAQYTNILGDNKMAQNYVIQYIANLKDLKEGKQDKSSSHYYRSAMTESNRRLQSLMNSYFGKSGRNSKFNTELLSMIYSQVGARLLTLKDNHIEVNIAEIDRLVAYISSQILQEIEAEIAIQKQEMKQKGIRATTFKRDNYFTEKERNNKGRITERIATLLDEKGAAAWRKIMEDEKINYFANKGLEYASTDVKGEDWELLRTGKLDEFFKQIHTSVKNAQVKVVPAYTQDEITSAVIAHTQGLIVEATGGVNAKPDEVYATSIRVETGMMNEAFQKVQQLLKENLYGANTEKDKGKLMQTNTSEYAKARHERNKKTIRALQNYLEELRRQNKLLDDRLFVIENSNKTSDLFMSGHEGGEFKGGSLGSSLKDILTKIGQIMDAYKKGSSSMTLDQLKMALLNCGDEMMGATYRSNLEEYLASFCSMLMFDDYIEIAETAKRKALQKKKLSTVRQIHLFTLGQRTVPLSVVLEHCLQFYQYEVQVLEDLANLANANYASKVTIINDASSATYSYGVPMTAEHWTNAAEQIEQQITIKVSLARGFLGILQREADRLLS